LTTTLSPPKTGNTRITGKEQYYTPKGVASSIMEMVAAREEHLSSRVFLEPAGGTGVFIEAARHIGFKQVLSWDIEPLHPEVIKGDFLVQNPPLQHAICVTNPPFGRNNSLSIPFFNHSAKFCDVIVFIVPCSWRKWSVINRLDRNFELVSDTDLVTNYCGPSGNYTHTANNLRTCVQYWRRTTTKRPLVAVEDRGLVEKCAPSVADVSLTVFGHGCGTVKTDFPPKPNTTQMFLRLKHPLALSALQEADFAEFYTRTAYTQALSLPEINYLLNMAIYGDSGIYDKAKSTTPP